MGNTSNKEQSIDFIKVVYKKVLNILFLRVPENNAAFRFAVLKPHYKGSYSPFLSPFIMFNTTTTNNITTKTKTPMIRMPFSQATRGSVVRMFISVV